MKMTILSKNNINLTTKIKRKKTKIHAKRKNTPHRVHSAEGYPSVGSCSIPISNDKSSTVVVDAGSNPTSRIIFNVLTVIKPRGRSYCLFSWYYEKEKRFHSRCKKVKFILCPRLGKKAMHEL